VARLLPQPAGDRVRVAGVIFYEFRKVRSQAAGQVALTLEQKEWSTTVSYLLSLKYTRVVSMPQGRFRRVCYHLVTSNWFQTFIYLVIVTNILEMCVWWYGMPESETRRKDKFNLVVYVCIAVRPLKHIVK
jgi:hypothetical protein